MGRRLRGAFGGRVLAAKVALVDLAGLDATLKAAVLMGLEVVLPGGGYAYVRRAGKVGER